MVMVKAGRYSGTLLSQLTSTADVSIGTLFTAHFLGRLLDRVNLIKPVSNVYPYVCAYVCPSMKSFFDFNKIWHVGRGRWVMHDCMQYDPIQGQGHESFKVGNPAIF